LAGSASTLFAQGTAFTYQGRLTASGAPADGLFDLLFNVYDAPTGGTTVGQSRQLKAVTVSQGLFSVSVDFGPGVFTGGDRWLDVAVRPYGQAVFATLTPRQKLSAAPYALSAAQVTGPISASQLVGPVPSTQLQGTYSAGVDFENPANIFAGNGKRLTEVTAVAVEGTLTNDITGNAATATRANVACVATVANNVAPGVQLTNPVISGIVSNVLTVADPAPTGTNAIATLAHGSLWLASAHHSSEFDNYWSGAIVWTGEGWDGTPVEPDSGWTPEAKLQFFKTWGGPGTAPALLLTSSNLRFEQGGNGSGYGYVQLGNEDAVGNVDINYTKFRDGGVTNVLSHPLSFTVVLTNEYYHPGIFARPAWPPVGDIQSYRAGELHFTANSPCYTPQQTYDGNNDDWTVMITRTNAVEATIALNIASNTPARWPSAPATPGGASFVNSNGVIYLLTSGTGMTWTGTNRIAP
jgi:hypothetical protein